MRTTVSVDDQLLQLATLRANQRHQTLSEFIQSAIEHYLGTDTDAPEAPAVPVFTLGTGLLPGVDASSNRELFDAIDKE
jgi:Arc/MetJ family transcription regulator